MSKTGYLALGRLRAQPLLQLRTLCAQLHDRTLPLDHPGVQVRSLPLTALRIGVVHLLSQHSALSE